MATGRVERPYRNVKSTQGAPPGASEKSERGAPPGAEVTSERAAPPGAGTSPADAELRDTTANPADTELRGATASSADAELRDAIMAGDRAAFTELFEQHAEKVWNHAYRLTGSWSEADELLSLVFLTAWRRRRQMTLVAGGALPWLYVVTGNVCRGERRRVARLAKALPRLLSRQDPDHAERVVERDAAAERLVRVLAAVDRLPRAQREAVQLCLLGGTSPEDAAELLGITVHSVQSRLSRARAQLTRSVPED
jgi:RNA polymerase sigma factor (sigma-70 family)